MRDHRRCRAARNGGLTVLDHGSAHGCLGAPVRDVALICGRPDDRVVRSGICLGTASLRATFLAAWGATLARTTSFLACEIVDEGLRGGLLGRVRVDLGRLGGLLSGQVHQASVRIGCDWHGRLRWDLGHFTSSLLPLSFTDPLTSYFLVF